MLQKVEAALLAALAAEQHEDASTRLAVLLEEVRSKIKEIGE